MLDLLLTQCRSDYERRIVRAAFASRGKNKGRIRESKPFDSSECREGADDAEFKGCANYFWRMLAFDCIGYGKHVCMPVTAEWDYSAACRGREDRRELVKVMTVVMDYLVTRVVRVLPLEARGGVVRWGRALGRL